MAEHRGGSGNFAEDKEKASEAGRKGGQHSGGNFKNVSGFKRKYSVLQSNYH
uniref:general stress protein n=1 Tax=Salmonella enterica TaxID=28901 RepID=UPI00111B7866